MQLIIGFFIGFIIGITTMLVFIKNRDNYYEKRAKELVEDEIAMMGWLEVKDE